jgi:hypothetical protein
MESQWLWLRNNDVSTIVGAIPVVGIVAITDPVDASEGAIIRPIAQFGADRETGDSRNTRTPVPPTAVMAMPMMMTVVMAAVATPMVTIVVMTSTMMMTSTMVMTTVAQSRRHTSGCNEYRGEYGCKKRFPHLQGKSSFNRLLVSQPNVWIAIA